MAGNQAAVSLWWKGWISHPAKVLSPLDGVKQDVRLAQRLDAWIVNYADDLGVICCKHSAHEALEGMRQIMARLKLTVNENKTRVCRVPEQTFWPPSV